MCNLFLQFTLKQNGCLPLNLGKHPWCKYNYSIFKRCPENWVHITMFHAPIIYYWIEFLYPRYIWRLRPNLGQHPNTYYRTDICHLFPYKPINLKYNATNVSLARPSGNNFSCHYYKFHYNILLQHYESTGHQLTLLQLVLTTASIASTINSIAILHA